MSIEVVVALFSAVLGGGLFKGVEVFLLNKRDKYDLDRQFREEYRTNITYLKEEIKELKKELGEERRVRNILEEKEDRIRAVAYQSVIAYNSFRSEVRGYLTQHGLSIPDGFEGSVDLPEI